MPQSLSGPSLASGMGSSGIPRADPFAAGGTTIGHNPAASPTDAIVNNLAEQDRAMKNERRSQWLSMNHSPAGDVLASLGADMGGLQGQGAPNPAAAVLANTIGAQDTGGLDDALLKRLAEVAIRRVARKRGVAVETPSCEAEGKEVTVTVTYVDDGRVLDSPDALSEAFQHAIATEIALKGHEMDVNIVLRRRLGERGEIDVVSGAQEEMFACEVCDGLVSENDSTCPHCGAVFEDEDEEEADAAPARSGPPGPSRGGPPGPSKGGPPGPKKGGPPGPSKGGPPGPKKGGPPGPSKGGPPGPKKGGPPKGGPSGGPPKGGPSGGPRKGGPSGGPPKGPRRGPPGR